MRKSAFRRCAAFLLAMCMLVGLLPTQAFATEGVVKLASSATKVSVPSDRVYITSSQYTLVPGATETVLTTNNTSGTNQRIGYLLEVSADALASGKVKAAAAYKDYQYDELGFQTVIDQAKAYEAAHPGETVIAGINADFFNMTTGAPTGALVMNGVVCNEVNNQPYFAILKDGTAVIRDGSHSDLSDVYEAVAGNEIIVTDGVVTSGTNDYDMLSYSRTAVGIKADGSIITYVTHGISVPTSCGETYEDVAKILVAQGCQYALMLDGGGSATYASAREGTGELVAQNSPSDGTPRTVSDTLLFVSTASSDGVFDHASITPNNAYYTPSSSTDAGLLSNLLGLGQNLTTVQFEAVGIDASGAACDLPESGLVWALAEGSETMGSIDTSTGLFTAAVGQVGTVGVELKLDGQVVGSTEIQLVEPDELYFSGKALSLDFSASSNLGLNVKGQGVDLNIKDGDFTWTVEPETIGTVENNTFYAAEKQNEALDGTVTVSYTKADGTVLESSIDLEIGKMPIVAMDFEEGEDFQVGLWDWGTSGGYFTDGQQRTYVFDNTDVVYYLRRQYWNGSVWVNTGDSAWIENCYATEQPWVENEDGSITMTYIKGEDGWDDAKLTTGQKTTDYGTDGSVWVVYGDIGEDLVAGQSVRYAWTVYLEQSVFSSNYNGNRPAATLLAANGYDMYIWHTNANPTDEENNGLHGAGSQVVTSETGEVRFGDYALKLTYDFRNFSPTGSSKNCNTYYRVTEPLIAQGSPTGLGMWVYAPEGMSNFWFWTRIFYWNGSQWTSSYIHYKPAGAEQTCQYTGVNWTGWTYVEADLSSIYAAGAVVDEEHPIQIRDGESLILLTYIPGGTSDGYGHAIVCGSKSAGYFYIDNVRWVYGTNVDDMDSPQIVTAKANETVLSASTATELDANKVTFSIDYTDPQGENYSGIDVTATQLYLDGSVLSSSDFVALADRAQTVELTLANGEHTLQISICDNFGNRTSQTYAFVVNNPDSTIPAVTIERAEKAELGGDYTVTIKADSLENIDTVSTTITYENVDTLETVKKTLSNSTFYDDYGNALTQGADGNYYDPNGVLVEEPMRPSATGDYSISSAVQTLGENLTGIVRNKLLNSTTRSFTAEATVNESVTEDTELLTFTLPVPHTLTELDTVPYTVTVTYTTKDGGIYTVTSGKQNTPLWAYYTLEPGLQIAGAESGTITVKAADGSAVDSSQLAVYGDASTQLEGTFNGDVFTTSYFTQQAAGTSVKQVWVGDDANKHYSFYTALVVASGAQNDTTAYDMSLNATTGDSQTSENITWFADMSSNGTASVQYMTKAAYDKACAETGDVDVDAVFANAATAAGTAKLTEFGADNVAAYINRVQIEGLTPGTAYVYRAGDGENWSEVAQFKTDDEEAGTQFVVVADTQLSGNASEDQAAIDVLNAIGAEVGDIDLGIQTGDFVDGGIQYSLWDQILGVWGEAFPTVDFVHVMGNHETYGTTGSTISSALFGLDTEETDYYSVEYGDVYIAVINQTAAADLSKAAEWLIEDAAKTDCTWKILTIHQPVYYTNPNGSSQGHNLILAPACDAAGIDFVFSGHDHSYARTEQMYAGEPVDLATDEATNAYVDANGDFAATQGQGTVYFICGDLGEKSRESGYRIVDNADFHFAETSQDYDALYLTVDASSSKLTVNAWNMTDAGSVLLDTYTMYSGAGACGAAGEHVFSQDTVRYNAETGSLICDRCGAEIPVTETGYTGYAVDVNDEDEYGDSQYYFLLGNVKTGFFAMGEEFLYANEQGLIDHAVENYTTNTCTVNGRNMAYSPRYDLTYTGGIARYTGHSYKEQEDGTLKCSVCGHVAVDISDWNYSLTYTVMTYDGTAKTPAMTIQNPETGDKLVFHTDGTGIMTDYTRIWSNNRNVGTATVTIEANPNGDYTSSKGPVTLTLEIRPDLPSNVTATASGIGSVEVSWTAAKAADTYVVYYSANGTTWKTAGQTSDTSYTVTGLNANAEYYFRIRSQATVEEKTYNSIGYTTPVEVTTSEGIDLSDFTVAQTWKTTVYNGAAKTYGVTSLKVTDPDGNVLTRNKDYTLTYSDNVNVGTVTVTITGIGVYQGAIETTFAITQQSLTGTAATAEGADAVFDASGATTTFVVKDKNGLELAENVDYTVTYSDNTAVGVASATITGIGNYKGSIKTTFNVAPKNIADLTAVVNPKAVLIYTGSEVKPAILINGLTENTDFTVVYADNVEAGTATATITGIGNYTGTQEITFKVEPADLADAAITDGSTYSYTGAAIVPDLNVISAGGALLVEGKDYEIASLKDNVEVGTATVTIQGIGNYAGNATHTFAIQQADIASFTVTLAVDRYVYGGVERKPAVTVENAAGVKLEKDTDFTVAYSDNKNAGVATVTVTGIGKYTGTVERNFTIAEADLTACTATLSYTSTTFSGVEKKPSVTVKTAKGTVLKNGSNYSVTYSDNRNAGTATVTITGIGNYAGTLTRTFTIKAKAITTCTATANTSKLVYVDGQYVPSVTVATSAGTTLKNGTSYVVSYSTLNGVTEITVTGIGNYRGELTLTVDSKIDISACQASLSFTRANYSGTAKRPAATVTDQTGAKLIKGTDYTVTYENNVEIGTATVTIKGIGHYYGTLTKTFRIRPVAPTNVQVASVTKTTAKITFDRNEMADKYYIYVNGKYVGAALTVDYYTIKGLTSGTSYSVSVKAVTVVDGVNYYSSASSAVRVTTAK